MVALFFACEAHEDTGTSKRPNDLEPIEPDGRVHVFAVPETLIKQHDSDSVSIIANFFKLRSSDQQAILEEIQQGPAARNRLIQTVSIIANFFKLRSSDQQAILDKKGNDQVPRIRLIQLIRAEKPYFDDRIDENDLSRVFVVEPQHAFQRIRAQESAYIVSARHLRFEPEKIAGELPSKASETYRHYTLQVPNSRKEYLLKQLGEWGFTRERLFPGLESSAQAINREYVDRARSGEGHAE